MTETPEVQTWSFGRLAEYPSGPWDGEPDKAQWVDETTDLDCLIVRGPLGNLCGYVGVPPGHPWHGRDAFELDMDVHGGLNYSAGCDEANPDGICHVPAPGRPADVWWFGFDCGHAFDITPFMLVEVPGVKWSEIGSYKNLGYIGAECTRLAAQLAAAGK